MKIRFLITLFLLVAVAFVWGGCTSAETGASNQAGDPQPEVVTPAAVEPSPSPAVRDSVPPAPRRVRTAPRVKSSQDTVRAATARKTRPAVKTAPLVKPANASYTVQVGAFRRASNALRLQRAVKRQYPSQPVFNDYHPADKLYRITVGKFLKRSEASALRKRLIAADSTAYGLCWVTYSRR